MKKIIIFVLCCFVVCGCDNNEVSHINNNKDKSLTYKKISALEAYSMMNNDVLIIDVRSNEEYITGHIENAVNIPVDKISEEILNYDKSTVILLYCRSGSRALTAAKEIVDLGYENVYTFGGIIDWPYELIK